jgi:cell division protein ZipA
MDQSSLSPNELRVILALIGALVLAAIYFFSRPIKSAQGRRMPASRDANDERIEPVLGDADARAVQGELPVTRSEIDELAEAFSGPRSAPPSERKTDKPVPPKPAPRAPVGVRPGQPIERIVTLFVAARAEAAIHGSDLVVAAEKCGLDFGDLGIFHRLVDGKSDSGPIFSVANMVKPGSFDMSRVDEITTPGLSFFMALPGPLPALDAWDTMLPTAQRLAELLDATVLDEERNALSRQRIAHIRDELRVWDRKHEGQMFKPW